MKYILFILVLFLVGCQNVVCEAPYIRFEKTCCLDENSNSICDIDEPIKELIEDVPKEETIETTIKGPLIEEIIEDIEIIEERASFEVEITYMKGTIRLLDQAIVFINVINNDDTLKTYIVSINDNNWKVRSDPSILPMRVAVKKRDKNHIKLILQPNMEFISEKGNYTFDVSVRSEKDNEVVTKKGIITIK